MPVPRLLVSVRNAAEARTALAGGADLIDVKEPDQGSLGAAAPQTWRAVAEVVGQAVPLSAALGELADDSGVTVRQAHRTIPATAGSATAARQAWDIERPAGSSLAGYQFAKLGLAHTATDVTWKEQWRRAVGALPPGIVPVAVVYADWQSAAAPSPENVITVGASLGCGAMLIDTFDKHAGSLFNHLTDEALGRLLQQARALGWKTVLAGSLNSACLPRAMALAPDWVAVRGAVCRGDRRAELCGGRLAEFRQRMDRQRKIGPPVQLAQRDPTG